jgi:hypothetical protein
MTMQMAEIKKVEAALAVVRDSEKLLIDDNSHSLNLVFCFMIFRDNPAGGGIKIKSVIDRNSPARYRKTQIYFEIIFHYHLSGRVTVSFKVCRNIYHRIEKPHLRFRKWGFSIHSI